MEGRRSLETAEAEDATLIALAQDIDQHTTLMRNAVLESIASIRHRVHVQAADVIQRERLATIATEQKLIRQVANLEDLLARSQDLLEREKGLTEKLIAQRGRRNQRSRDLVFFKELPEGVARRRRLQKAVRETIQSPQTRATRQRDSPRVQRLANSSTCAETPRAHGESLWRASPRNSETHRRAPEST